VAAERPLRKRWARCPSSCSSCSRPRRRLSRAGQADIPRSRRALRSGPARRRGKGSPGVLGVRLAGRPRHPFPSLVRRVTIDAHREPTGWRPDARGRPPPRPTTPQIHLVRCHALRRAGSGRLREHLIRGVCGRPVIPERSGVSRPVSPHPEASPPYGRCARVGAARLAAWSWSTGGAPLHGARWEGGREGDVVPTARSVRPACAMRRVRHVLEPIARGVTMGGWLTCWRRCIPLTSRSHGSSVQAMGWSFASLTPVTPQ